MTPGILTFNISKKLKRFVVTDTSIQAMDNQIFLMIDFQRLSGPFWISLFIPSLLLILAAEIPLFIDGTHFKATIAVALTTTLTMYTLYSSFQAKLPEDARLKLVDIWLLHGLLMPMVVFVILVVDELLKSKYSEKSSNSKEKDVMGKRIRDMKVCMLMAKATVPTISILFIMVYFAINISKS